LILVAVSTFSQIGDQIKDLLRTIVDGEFTTHLTGQAKADDEDNFKKMKAVYQTCMNEDAIKAYGTKYVIEKLQEFEKVFPEQGPAFSASSNEELTKILIWLGKNFATGLVSVDVDVSNPTYID
jgi:endothelin-converting enzyme